MLMLLGFEENSIELIYDATKAEYVQKLTALKKLAEKFENANKEKETLAVAILNIGNRLDPLDG